MRRALFFLAAAALALSASAPADAGLFNWFGKPTSGSACAMNCTPGTVSGGGSAAGKPAGDSATDVPAPPALALFGMAVAGLLLGRRRQR